MAKIDLLKLALDKGVQPMDVVDMLYEDDEIYIGDITEYDSYTNTANKDNPNAYTSDHLQALHEQTKKLREVFNDGYFVPLRQDLNVPVMANALRNTGNISFRPKSQPSNIPYISSALSPLGLQNMANQKKEAYDAEEYAIYDEKEPGGYKYIMKPLDWEKLPGKFVYTPDPRTNGMTQMLELVPEGIGTAGRDPLSIWGPPETFVKSWTGATLANIAGFAARVPKYAVTTVQGFDDYFSISVGGQSRDIFDNQTMLDNYSRRMFELIDNEADKKLLSDALVESATGRKAKNEVLKLFNYLEQKLPLMERHRMQAMRLPQDYMRRQEGYNKAIDKLQSLENLQFDEMAYLMEHGHIGAFIYNSAGVLADMIPQIALSYATGGLGALAAGAGLAKQLAGRAAGGFIGSMIIGGAHAVGATLEGLYDAGFSKEEVARWMPLIGSALPLTEGLIGGSWMGRYGTKSALSTFKKALAAEGKEMFAKTGGKLAYGDAVELTRKSIFRFWENPAIKEFMQKSYFTRELPTAMLMEAAQENSEDLIYNGVSLALNNNRPDYYNDFIDSGINEWFGEEGVFNGKQILQTTLMTMFATGILDTAMAGMQGKFKKGYSTRLQDMAKTAWIAEQAATGKIGNFLDIARDDMAAGVEVSMFGSRKNKMADVGAENIVIPAEQAEQFRGANLGILQDDGSILIDNLADMRYLEFIQIAKMYESLANEHGLNGTTLNSKMLHELMDVGHSLLSSKALSIALDLKEVSDEIVEFEKANTDLEHLQGDKKTAYNELVAKREKAKEDLAYYTTLEEGTNYSPAVNNNIKTFLFSYDLAEEMTKQQMEKENLNVNNKKTYNKLRNNWNLVLQADHSYDVISNVYKNMLTDKNETLRLRAERLNKLNNITPEKFEAVSKQVDSFVDTINKTIGIKDNKAFASGMREVATMFDTLQNSILAEINNNFIPPSMVSEMTNRFTGIYNGALERLGGLQAQDGSLQESLEAAGIDENDAMLIATTIESGDTLDNAGISEEVRQKAAPIIEASEVSREASGVELPKRINFNISQDDYNAELAKAKEEASKPYTILDAYNNWMKIVDNQFQKAINAIDPEAEPIPNNEYYGMSPERINADIQHYWNIAQSLKNSEQLAKRLDGKKLFEDHASKDEQELLKILNNKDRRKEIDAKHEALKVEKQEYEKKSGMLLMSSLAKQKHTATIMLQTQARHLMFIIDKLQIRDKLPKDLYEDLEALDIDQLIDVQEDGQTVKRSIFNMKGTYDDAINAKLLRANTARINLLSHLQEKGYMNDQKNKDLLLEPFVRFKETINPQNTKNTTSFLSSVSYSGSFERPVRDQEGNKVNSVIVYDPSELRYDASRVDLININPLVGTEMKSARRVHVEALQQYSALLAIISIPKSKNGKTAYTLREIYQKRRKIYANSNANPSTFEQTIVEDTIIAMLLGSPIATDIANIYKDTASIENINNALIIPGDYGTGKTQHVLRRAFVLMRHLGVPKNKIDLELYAPSNKLSETHAATFADIFNSVTTKSFKSLPDMKGAEDDMMKIIIIDEGSLLSSAEIDIIQAKAKAGGSRTKFIFLADMNQMRQKKDMQTEDRSPFVMRYAFKAATLTEQFSTDSPIIQQHASYWKELASLKRSVGNLDNIPNGYYETHNGYNYGVRFNSSELEVVSNFLGAINSSKALVFEDHSHYENFLAAASEEVRSLLMDKKNNDKIYFLYYEGKVTDRVIQGLREEEIYLARDPFKMFFHQENTDLQNNDFVGVYTAVGRASRYMNMNIGVAATEKMATEASKAFPIGRIDDNSKLNKQKVESMRVEAEKLFTELDLKEGDDVKEEASQEKATPKEKTKSKAQNEKSGTATIQTQTDEEIKVNYTIEPTEEGRANLMFSLPGYGKQVIEVNDDIKTSAIPFLIEQRHEGLVYDEKYKRGTSGSVKTNLHSVEISSGNIIKIGDTTNHGDVIEIYSAEGKTYVEFQNWNGEITRSLVSDLKGLERIDVDAELDATKVFMSQAVMLNKHSAVYTTPYMYFGKDRPTDEEYLTIRAVRSFILQNAPRFGIKLKLVAYPNQSTYWEASGSGQESFVISVDAEGDLTKMLLSMKDLTMAEGRVKEFAKSITKDNVKKHAQQFKNLSIMAAPLVAPYYKTKTGYSKLDRYYFTANGDHSMLISTIRKNYQNVLDKIADETLKNQLIQQREAQIKIAQIYLDALEIHKSQGTDNAIDISDTSRVETRVKVEYGGPAQNLDDFLQDLYDKGYFFFDESAVSNLSLDSNGRIVFNFTMQPTENAQSHRFIVNVKKLNEDKRRTDSMLKEDKKILSAISVSKTKFDNGNAAIVADFDSFEEAIRKTHAYKILAANRANIQKNKGDKSNAKSHNNYARYFDFGSRGGFINIKGETTSERKANLEALVDLIYSEWNTELYNYVERDIITSVDGDSKLGGFAESELSKLKVNIKRINDEYFFFDYNKAVSRPETKKTSQPKSNPAVLKKKGKGLDQLKDADTFDRHYMTEESARRVIKSMLGDKFTKSRMEFVYGFINHDGKLATGMVLDGYMYLASSQNGIRFSTPYHEAMHIIWEDLIDPVARKKYEHLATKIAFKETGKMLYGTELKEWMASDFAKRAMYKAGILTHEDISESWRLNAKEMTLWQKFKAVMHDILNFFVNFRSQMDVFYDDVLNGKYQEQELSGNTYKMFESEASDTSIPEEEAYEEDVNADISDRYISLNNTIKQYFPDSIHLVRRFEGSMRYGLIKSGLLGNFYNPDYPSIGNFNEAIHAEIETWVDYHNELGEVFVLLNGEYVRVKDLLPADYDNIIAPPIEGENLSEDERIRSAKADMRRYFITDKENVTTIYRNMIPEFNPETDYMKRAKASNKPYEKESYDAFNEGFTTELNFHMASIPKIRLINGEYTIDERAGEFIDPRAAKNLYIEVGHLANELYMRAIATNPENANIIDAFRQALNTKINGYISGSLDTALNNDGSFKSKNAEALVSMAIKFFGVKGMSKIEVGNNFFVNEDGDVLFPMASIAGIIFQKYAGQALTSEESIAEVRRARHIASFVSMFSALAASKKITHNSKMSISQLKDDVFTHSYTQYSNNNYERVVNEMKDKLSGKMSYGQIANEISARVIRNTIEVLDDGSIEVGSKRSRNNTSMPFINAERDKAGMRRWRYSIVGDTDSFISGLRTVGRHLGLPKKVLSDSMIRRIIRSGSTMPDVMVEAIAKQLKDHKNVKLQSAFQSAEEMLVTYVANIINANIAQTTMFQLDMTYTISGKDFSYSNKDDIRTHISELNSIIQKNPNKIIKIVVKQEDKDITISGKGATLFGKLFNQEFLLHNLPMLAPVYDFMDRIGVTSVLKRGNSEEYFSSLGIPLPTPSQFYPVTEVLAAFVSGQRGNHEWPTNPMPNKKRRPAAQGRNELNDMIDGSAGRINRMVKFFEAHPEAKELSPYFDKQGRSLVPYLRTDKNEPFVTLDHIDDFMGLERNFGGVYSYGKNQINTHDFFLSSFHAFLSKVKSSSEHTQMIAMPTMTISSTGKVYVMNHQFSPGKTFKSHIVNYTKFGEEQEGGRVTLDYAQALHYVRNQVAIIERQIELSNKKFNDFIDDVNRIIGDKNLFIKLGVESKTKGIQISKADFVKHNAEYIKKQLDKLPIEKRSQIIELARQSNLVKGKEIIINDEALSFSMGEVVMDDIRDLTALGNIYSKSNRDYIKAAKDPEKALKTVFRRDFISFADYMSTLGLDANEKMIRDMTEGAFVSKEKEFSFYGKDSRDVTKLNNSLFAYYMMFHISNNLFDILNGNAISYNGVMDQVKRMGPQNTPVISMDTNIQIDGNYIGSLPANGIAISIKDIKVQTAIKPELDKIVDALDGSSILSPLQRRMFNISTGGTEYSIVGQTSMIKTLGLFRDPVSGAMTEIKHAGKYITEGDFNGSPVYKRMVLDLFKAQDQHLDENVYYKELIKGTKYQDYSFYNSFVEYYNKTKSMDQAIDMLFEDLVNSQYYNNYPTDDQGNYIDFDGNVITEVDIKAKHRAIYNIMASSVVYGYNPESVIKTSRGIVNNYDPNNAERLETFAFSPMDYTGLGIVNSSDQPMDDSKKQSPYQQIIGMLGYSPYKLTGIAGNPGAFNPGIAIMHKQNELYYEGMNLINAEISAIKPSRIELNEQRPTFNDVDWMNVESDTRDLSYALAQLEEFMRRRARAGMADATIQGNYIEMLSDMDISRQFPQMRNKLVQTYRNYINTHALKRGMNGMRATQASGVFHRLYYLKGSNDTVAYTREEAMEHANIFEDNIEKFEEVEERLAEKFDIRNLNDMRVEGGKTLRGQVVMPYAYASTLGLRRKGEMGATRDESVRDLFTLTIGNEKFNIKDLDAEDILVLFQKYGYDEDTANSVLVRKAIDNVLTKEERAKYRPDEYGEIAGIAGRLSSEIALLKENAIETLKVFAVRTPSNGLGNGAWHDIVGFHNDGNVIYIPIGMTLLNNSDFDIDQLAVYFKKLDKKGHIISDTSNRLFNDILDITEEVYMAKENQADIFVESSIKTIKDIANKEGKNTKPTPFNSAYSLLKSYEENRTGDEAIGILVNTLSAAVYLSTLSEINKSIVPGTEITNPLASIVSKARKQMRGKESLVIMVGDWLQAALDNPKENALGKYGVIEESIPVLGAMIAKGPNTGESLESFFQRIKDFFNEYTVKNTFAQEALYNSLYYQRGTNNIYSSIQRHLANVKAAIARSGVKNFADMDKHAPQEVLDTFIKDKMLKDVNEYLSILGMNTVEVNDNMSDLERENLNNIIFNYSKSINTNKEKQTDKEKQQLEIINEYKRLQITYDVYNKRKGLQSALEALEQLDGLVTQAAALRNVSRLVGLRQGLPGKDSDRSFLIKDIELMFGADLKNIYNGENVTEQAFKEYFKSHSNDYIIADDMERQLILDKAVRVFKMINLREYLKSNPMTRVHISELLREQALMGKMFFIDSPSYRTIENTFIRKTGYNTWKHKTQWTTFMEAFSGIAIDRYFDKFWNKTLSVALPIDLGENYIPGEGILSQLNLSNVHHRELFTLVFPEMVNLLQENYTSATDMENAFYAVSPEFAGIAKSFFDKNGQRISNAFVDNLTIVGSNQRNYVGLGLSTSEISQEARLQIQEDFNKLPEFLKELFMANEIIINKMHYKKGSISDAIGVDMFRAGLSAIYNDFYADVQKGNIFTTTEQQTLFEDYVSTLGNITQYVKNTQIDQEDNPEYFHSFTGPREGNIQIHYKRDIATGEIKALYHLTPRAGLTMNPKYNVISNMPRVMLTGDELVQLEDTNVPVVKIYPKGHNFRAGYYLTEMGRSVYLEPEGNVIILTNREMPSDYTAIKSVPSQGIASIDNDAFETLTLAPNQQIGETVIADQNNDIAKGKSKYNYPDVVTNSGMTLAQLNMAASTWNAMPESVKENYIKCN